VTPPTYLVQPIADLRPADLVDTYEGLTFPPIERRAELRLVTEPLFGAAALGEDGPVGLVAAKLRTPELARILSLLVEPAHRGRGIATHLLARCEELAAERGVREIEGLYRTSWRSREAIERLLRTAGWSEPQTRHLIGRGATESLGSLGTLPPANLPPELELFSWQALAPEEERAILDRQEREGWFPEALSPFQVAPRLEREISVGLRARGEVAGWMIVHRLAHDTVQYSALFVRDDLRRTGAARALVAEAIRRRLQNPAIRHGVFLVDARNEAMLRFAKGPLRPLLTKVSELRVATKAL
jgi:GNAT superfamily N-acetyltransferase